MKSQIDYIKKKNTDKNQQLSLSLFSITFINSFFGAVHPASLMRVSEKYDPYNNSNEMKETIIKITVKQFEFSCTRTIYGIPFDVVPIA